MSQTTKTTRSTQRPTPGNLPAHLAHVARQWYAHGLPVPPSWLPLIRNHTAFPAQDIRAVHQATVHLSVTHAAEFPPATARATLAHPTDLLATFAAGALPHSDLVALIDAYLFATGHTVVDVLCATTLQRATHPALGDAINDAREDSPTLAASYARLAMLHAGWPEPALMVDVLEVDGRYITSVDLAYPRHRIGYVADSPAQHRDMPQQLIVNRQLALKRAGWRVVTIPWPTPPAHDWPAAPTSLAA